MQKSIILLAFALVSCFKTQEKMIEAFPLLDKIKANKEMDEDTKKGLFDGCFTGYNARGNTFYKTSLYFRQNPKMASNDKYMFAWGRGYGVCFTEANTWTHMQIGGKIINPTLMQGISPLAPNSTPTVPVGNDAESQPAVWYFDEDPNRGIPGTANYGTNHNFFGVFGSCIWC